MVEPFPLGTFVLCTTPDGVALRESCRRHIFKLTSEPTPVDWGTTSTGVPVGTGFVQMARCLVCQWATMPMSTEFWSHKADAMDLAACFGQIDESIQWLQDARVELERAWLGLCEEAGTGTAPPAMRNFE